MEEHLFSVGSITYALKGRDMLRDYGYNAAISRKTGKAVGCGYYIRANGDKTEIENILKKGQINFTSI